MNAEPIPTATATTTRVLPAHECWELLRSTTVGRLALSQDGQPEIFPVNHVVDHGTIVYRTARGAKSYGAENALVAFEADGSYPDLSVDDSAGAGEVMVWSVVAKGRAETIAVTSELIATVQLPLHPWERGRKDRFMRVVPETITGRAFQRSSLTEPVNPDASAS